MASLLSESLLVICVLFESTICSPVLNNNDDQIQLLEKTKEIKSYINTSVDPCEDFNEFSCGNWATLYPADQDPDANTSFLKRIMEVFDQKVLEMLENDNDPADTITDTKIKNFYKSCIGAENVKNVQKIIEFISEFGTMPALNETDWDESNFDWLETVARIQHKYGLDIIIAIDIFGDLKNKNVNRIYFKEQELALQSKSMYMGDGNYFYRNSYEYAMTTKLKEELGIEREKAGVLAHEFLEIEFALAKGMLDDKVEINLNKLVFNTTIDDLHAKYAPEFDIKKYFKIVFGEIPIDVIYEYNPPFLENLKKFMQIAEKRKIANYVFYQLASLMFFKYGNTQEAHRKACLAKVQKSFSHNLDNMVYRRFNDKATEDDVQRIWDNLKFIFKDKLQSTTALDWITNTTRQTAIEKLDALKLKINSHSDRDFEEEYKDLETNDHDFMGNVINIAEWDAQRKFEKLNEIPTGIEATKVLSRTPALIFLYNFVMLPVATLQPYYVYAPTYPAALKYAIIGFFLSHELIHSFDDTGRQFSKTGHLGDWWDKKSEEEFNKRRECFINQYHNYIYDGIALPRNQMQSENIADNGGLKLAYDAYMYAHSIALHSNNKLPEVMPELDYTRQQLFFIGFAQIWCSDMNYLLRRREAAIDDHTPKMLRAVGAISNLPEFAEAFSCPANSKMNPKTKCQMY